MILIIISWSSVLYYISKTSCVFVQEGGQSSEKERFYSLLQMLNLENRIVTEKDAGVRMLL